jgi:hypothetical protein
MMEYGMWLVRLTLILGLIGQLLWAQGSLTPRPPCLKQLEPASAAENGRDAPEPRCRGRLPRQEEGRRCCPGRIAAARKRASAPQAAQVPARSAAETSAGGCDPANCCKRVPPRRPRPVDRIPAPQKQPMALMPALAPAPPSIAPAPVVHPGLRDKAWSVSNHARRAALCIWRN